MTAGRERRVRRGRPVLVKLGRVHETEQRHRDQSGETRDQEDGVEHGREDSADRGACR